MIESNLGNSDRVVSPSDEVLFKEAPKFENKLRPQVLSEYIGQDIIKKNLLVSIEAAKMRGEPMDHVLLYGPPGLGKTTLAGIIANECSANLKISSGPAFEKQSDLVSVLSNLQENDILFIDEIHRLKSVVEEVLYTAMEDFALDIMIGKGPSARSMRINLPRFTLIGATTRVSMLSSPFRDRFGNVFSFNLYEDKDIYKILLRSAGILGCTITDDAANKLASSSRKTPRIANRLLKRVRDYAQVKNLSELNLDIASDTLDSLGIDALGLDHHDRQLLSIIVDKFAGGPVGLSTLAAASSMEGATIEDIYEPFLIQIGFLERSPRGRIATGRARRHVSTLAL